MLLQGTCMFTAWVRRVTAQNMCYCMGHACHRKTCMLLHGSCVLLYGSCVYCTNMCYCMGHACYWKDGCNGSPGNQVFAYFLSTVF